MQEHTQPEVYQLATQGRTLEWHEYGVTDGSHRQVLLYCHGTPGTGLEAEVFDALARQEKVLVIAIDRPGLGGSSTQKPQPVAAWVQDAVAVLTHRAVERCLLIGYSGGGPYCFALALAYPELVKAVALLAPFTHQNRISKNIELTISPTTMSLQKHIYRALSRPRVHKSVSVIMRQLKKLPGSEHGLTGALTTDVSGRLYLDNLLLSHVHAFEHSTAGALNDLTAIHSPWGFEVQNLPTGVRLDIWLGNKDRVISNRGARALAGQLGGIVHEVPGQGHTALYALTAPKALAELLAQDGAA